MLSNRTTHCPSGHLLEGVHLGKRQPVVPASSVLDVQQIGWCDVCIEPFELEEEDERYTCPACSYDCCWRCAYQGRENYLVTITFTTGQLAGETVYGTLDVLKKNIKDLGGAEDEVVAKGLLTFDFEMNGLTWGRFPDEIKALRNAKVTFSKSTGVLVRFELLYENAVANKDFEEYGMSIDRIGFNTGFPTPPDSETTAWVGVVSSQGTENGELLEDGSNYITSESFGTVECRRFGLAEVPGFGHTEDQDSSVVLLLRSIAKHKRQVMDPMRSGNGYLSPNRSAPPKLSLRQRLFRGYSRPPTDLGQTTARQQANAEQVEKVMQGLNLNKYQTLSETGKVHHRDLIYCSRLSLLAYLTDRIKFQDFFPINRETYLLDPLWVNFLEQVTVNEGKEILREWLGSQKNEDRKSTLFATAHGMFVGRFVSTFFDNQWGGVDFGRSLPLMVPLQGLGLELNDPHCGKFAVNGIEGFVSVSENFLTLGGDICLVFQGTNGAGDILVDFNGLTTPFEPLLDDTNAGKFACLQGRGIQSATNQTDTDHKLRVHLGFYNAFLSIKPYLERAVRYYLKETPKSCHIRIVVTGHSLGGALANMCTAWLLQALDSNQPGSWAGEEITGEATDRLRVLCVSFGSPKIGITSFVEWMDAHRFLSKLQDDKVRFKILRLIDVQDPIATLPPSGGLFDYMHTSRSGATIDLNGELIFITREDCNKIDTTSRGLSIIAKKGSNSMLYHDLFVYLNKCLHFAWNLTEVEDMDQITDWENGPLERAFGGDSFRYDAFTRSPEFLHQF
ncbi:hypothetical protein BASA81_005111 [Batrachochytrium salamandrivorans]|nr:hypothetical protein BASA81_005111 [Batrachochytrium salamandrivorans]